MSLVEAVCRIQLCLLCKAKAVKANLPFVCCLRVTLSEGKVATSLLSS